MNTSLVMEQKSLRPAQAAKYLGIGVSSLWRLARDPNFPRPFKLGPRITLFSREELDSFLASKRKDGGAS